MPSPKNSDFYTLRPLSTAVPNLAALLDGVDGNYSA